MFQMAKLNLETLGPGLVSTEPDFISSSLLVSDIKEDIKMESKRITNKYLIEKLGHAKLLLLMRKLNFHVRRIKMWRHIISSSG